MEKRSKNNKKAQSFNPGEELVINAVSEIREKMLQILTEKDSIDLDLGSISECDTAGVQLIISLLKYGEKRNKTISILNATNAVTEEMSELGFCPDELISKGN